MSLSSEIPATRPILFVDASRSHRSNALAAVDKERASLKGLAEKLGVDLIELDHPTVGRVDEAIGAHRPGILHACAHGAFDADTPDLSSLVTGAGRPFRPADLTRNLRHVLIRERPLVFLNACQLGRDGWSLTGRGGWAPRLIEAGVGAFVAPAWTVNDTSAAEFAEAFYQCLGRGENLGQAAWHARQASRKSAPQRSTWLAYRVHGDPAARLGRPSQPRPEARI